MSARVRCHLLLGPCLQALRKRYLWCCHWGCRGRTGGLAAQVAFALAHTATHLTAAVLALVLLELGVETCIRCA